MKQRWLHIMLLFLLMTMGCWQQKASATNVSDDQELVEHWLTFSKSQQKQQAMISDASQLIHLCSSRPERIVSTSYTSFSNNTTRTKPYFIFKDVFFRHYKDLQASPTSRIMLVPQSDYYVFRLRHLII